MDVIDLLEQEEFWLPLDSDTEVALTDLEDDHIVNLKGFLLRMSTRFHTDYLVAMWHFGSKLGGEEARDSAAQEIGQAARVPSLLWMERRPLYLAVCREINRRQGILTCRVIGES